MATHGVGAETELAHKPGGKVSDAEADGSAEATSVTLVSKETSHQVGEGNNTNFQSLN